MLEIRGFEKLEANKLRGLYVTLTVRKIRFTIEMHKRIECTHFVRYLVRFMKYVPWTLVVKDDKMILAWDYEGIFSHM